jgi:muconolactone delta-isomerase
MLYSVRMDVNLPPDMPADQADAIKTKERDYSQELQRDGRCAHLCTTSCPRRVQSMGVRYAVAWRGPCPSHRP